MRLSAVMQFAAGVLPLVNSLSLQQSTRFEDVELEEEAYPTLEILQNVLTAISTDVLALDKATLAAQTTSDVPYILRNITKLDQTIKLSTKTVSPAENITADLALTLQKFGGQLAKQVLTMLSDLVGAKDLIGSVANGTQSVRVGLTAVQSATKAFTHQVQNKVPASVWIGVAAPLVQNVTDGLKEGITAYT